MLGVADGHRNEIELNASIGIRLRGFRLRTYGVGIGPVLRDRRKPVVQVLGGLAHEKGFRIDEALGEEPRVGIDTLAHRVPGHVLDAAGEGEVDLAGHDR